MGNLLVEPLISLQTHPVAQIMHMVQAEELEELKRPLGLPRGRFDQ